MSNWNSIEELKKHLLESGGETEILSGDDDEPKTEARQQMETEERQARLESLYADFLLQVKDAGLPEPVRELEFWPGRNWRFDLAWEREKISLEIEGGIWMSTGNFGKGHAHPKRFTDDCEKYSHAAIAGWCLLRATTEQVKDGSALKWLQMAFDAMTPGKPLWEKMIGYRLVSGLASGLVAPGSHRSRLAEVHQIISQIQAVTGKDHESVCEAVGVGQNIHTSLLLSRANTILEYASRTGELHYPDGPSIVLWEQIDLDLDPDDDENDPDNS